VPDRLVLDRSFEFAPLLPDPDPGFLSSSYLTQVVPWALEYGTQLVALNYRKLNNLDLSYTAVNVYLVFLFCFLGSSSFCFLV
jgi:hypothetical protein